MFTAFVSHMITHWCLSWFLVSKGKGTLEPSSVGMTLFNQLCVTLPLSLIDVWKPMLKYTPNILFNLIITFLGYFSVAEIVFYSSHRLLHIPFLYKHIHKRHHQWQIPMTLATLDAHPIEHFLTNVAPVLLGPYLLGTNMYILTSWVVMATVNSILAHSGYSRDDYHTDHHKYINCNYGIFKGYGLDKLFGTERRHKV